MGFVYSLEVLNVCDVGITEIVIPAEERLFMKVHTLYASENYIRNVSNSLPFVGGCYFLINCVLVTCRLSST